MKISFIVILSHLLVISSLIYLQSPSHKRAPRNRVVVRTKFEAPASPKLLKLDHPISLLIPSPPTAEPIASVEPEPPKPAVVKPIESKTPPKLTPKASKQPAPVTKPKTTAKPIVKKEQPKKEQPNPNQQKLISMMQQSLNRLETGGAQERHTAQSSRATIGALASEALSFEAKYEEELVIYLESLLSLPEKGDVKLKLTLKREGNVQKIDILKTTSESNKKYVESTLIPCCFPSFGSHFKGEIAHTFTITLVSH